MQNHVKFLDLNVTMDTGRIWSCHLNCEADVSHAFNRAREVLETRLEPYAYNPDPPPIWSLPTCLRSSAHWPASSPSPLFPT